MTQCAKIIAGFMANVGNVFIKRLQTVFFNFFHVLLRFIFFNVSIFIRTFITSMVCLNTADQPQIQEIVYVSDRRLVCGDVYFILVVSGIFQSWKYLLST